MFDGSFLNMLLINFGVTLDLFRASQAALAILIASLVICLPFCHGQRPKRFVLAEFCPFRTNICQTCVRNLLSAWLGRFRVPGRLGV